MATVPVDFACNVSSGFLMDPNQHQRIGWVTKLDGFGLPTGGLTADLQVSSMAEVPPFRELIAAMTVSAVHLEMRDAYTPHDEGFLDWQAGNPVPVPALPEWHDLVRASVARGIRFRRARIVSEPVAPFIRYEYDITDGTNIAAGEEVEVAAAAPDLGPSASG